MTQNELASVWHRVLADLREPNTVWQLLALAACLLLAKRSASVCADRPARSTPERAQELGHGGLKRIAFPLLALLLVLVARPLARGGCTSACSRWRCPCWALWRSSVSCFTYCA